MYEHPTRHCLAILSAVPSKAALQALDRVLIAQGCQLSCWAGIVVMFDQERWSEQRRLSVTGNILGRWLDIPIVFFKSQGANNAQDIVRYWRTHAKKAPQAIRYRGKPHITKPTSD